MKRYEYNVDYVGEGPALETRINLMAANGWKLHTVLPLKRAAINHRVIFEREKEKQ